MKLLIMQSSLTSCHFIRVRRWGFVLEAMNLPILLPAH
jgi:hypothetical protein